VPPRNWFRVFTRCARTTVCRIARITNKRQRTKKCGEPPTLGISIMGNAAIRFESSKNRLLKFTRRVLLILASRFQTPVRKFARRFHALETSTDLSHGIARALISIETPDSNRNKQELTDRIHKANRVIPLIASDFAASSRPERDAHPRRVASV
jgi:hypothetical protein